MLANRYDQYVGRSIFNYGEYSEGESTLFRQLVGAGDGVVEAGANIGAHTLLLAQLVGEGGLVFAYEPQRIVFQTLCANLALGQCRNVIARQQGLGREAGEMIVAAADPRLPCNFGGLSLIKAGPGEKIAIQTIDSLELERCALIKADVEGMEAEVLLGATQTVQRCRPVLYLENDRVDRAVELIGLVLGMQYRLWWHITPLFNPDNFAQNPVNIFGNILSINMLCLPAESPRVVEGLYEIKNGTTIDWPPSPSGRFVSSPPVTIK